MGSEHRNLKWILMQIFLTGVLCNPWGVEYKQLQICAVRGSSAVISCKFYFTGLQILRRVKWGHRESQDQVERNDAGKYNVRFYTDKVKGGLSRGDGPTLKVVDLRIYTTKPSENETIKEGDSVSLICKNDCDGGNSSSAFTWFKDGELLSEGSSLHLTNISFIHSGNYTCSIKTQPKTASRAIRIAVEYAPKNTSVLVHAGTNFTLICNSHANPPVENYTWFREDESEDYKVVGLQSVLSPAEGGRYFCSAANKHGSRNSTTVRVQIKATLAAFTRNLLIVAFVVVLLIVGTIVIVIRLNRKKTWTLTWTPRVDSEEEVQDTEYVNWLSCDYNPTQEGSHPGEVTELIYATVDFSDNATDIDHRGLKMKCPNCGDAIERERAKFCSECGYHLRAPPANTQEDQPRSLVADSESAAEKSGPQKAASPDEGKEANKSPKRPSDESSSSLKKKKKKRKKNKKKKDGTSSLDQDQSLSDMSHVSVGGDQSLKSKSGGDSSDSESSDNAMDETPESLQEGASPMECQPDFSEADTPAAPPEDNQVNQSGATAEKEEAAPVTQSEEDPGKVAQDQTPNTDTPTLRPPLRDNKTATSQTPADKGTKTTNNKDLKNERKSSKNRKDTADTRQPTLDQNANEETSPKQTGQDKQKGKSQQEQKQKQTAASGQKNSGPQTRSKGDSAEPHVDPEKTNMVAQQSKSEEVTETSQKQTGQNKQKGKSQQEQKKNQTAASGQMVFGPQTQSEVQKKTGSSVDPEDTNRVDQQSKSGEVAETSPNQTGQSKQKGKNQQEQKQNQTAASGQRVFGPQTRITRNKTIAASDRLTIYFHAVLSKDFKFDPNEDRVFVRAGCIIGEWEDNAAELSVTRNLGDHGFLVEGSLTTYRSDAVSHSIPYKYVVYKNKKERYEFEFIYKLESASQHTVNRCLFVKSHMLNEEGDWHQYDDIVCAEPSKNVLKRWTDTLKDALWRDQKKDLIQGINIAGNIMLETIFDLLRSWSVANVKSFLVQLDQFFQVYSDPFVFDDKQRKRQSLDYGKDNVKKMLKDFLLERVIPQVSEDGVKEMLFVKDPMRAAVIMLCLWNEYGFHMKDAERYRLCAALCLPNMHKEHFLQYWEDFLEYVPLFKNLEQNLVTLINTVRRVGMPRWILVLPLLHLLKGTTKPFEVPASGNSKYGLSWAGLLGLETSSFMNSQDRKALINLMKSHSHLMEVDALLVRSVLYLMRFEDLKECLTHIHAELLDVLHISTNKAPTDITFTNFQTVFDILSYIQEHLIEEKYSALNMAYRRLCLSTAVRLLDKLCRAVRLTSTSQSWVNIPVACMQLVASVSDFIHSNIQQVSEEGREEQRHAKDVVMSYAMANLRDWMSSSFRYRLLNRSVTSLYNIEATVEIEVWSNLISMNFRDDDITTEWRQTFTNDFEGKYKKDSALDQIEFYCTKTEELSKSHPHIAASIEKCALEAVTALCQNKSEGRLFERLQINWKFGKLISAIIEKSWPKDGQGKYQEDDEVVLRHLLSWTAAKNIFQLHGADKNLIEKLSQEAMDRIAIAISSLTAMTEKLVCGDIKISMLSIILDRSTAFLDLLKIDCLADKEQYRDGGKMRRLIQCRRDEVTAVYHEKELVDTLLTMSHKLEEHMTGMAVSSGQDSIVILVLIDVSRNHAPLVTVARSDKLLGADGLSIHYHGGEKYSSVCQ
ncbi:E3 ubiquitin-protein ligase rnf213-alpha [Xyrichtys novacula]|uniref:E3 ubiquitin-protein ligase rnf213-alpha n=1 Tax=Xyrichtys novacula TaxID=13765 RepID=A0AAV1GR79_XYRNO|nr:E3 ubiquitin-protein ligase rnf213-alpha [Xyrichtys novacula]